MKEFFYRLSWDKNLKKKVFSIGLASFCVCACVLGVTVVLIGNMHNFVPEKEEVITEKLETDEMEITFSDHGNVAVDKKKEAGKDQKNSNSSQQNDGKSSSGASGDSSSGGDIPGHVHSWFRVVDKQPWDETIWVQTGTKYVCRSCGYTTTSSEQASHHSSVTGHKFGSEPLIEPRTIHHDGISHEECACGARR